MLDRDMLVNTEFAALSTGVGVRARLGGRQPRRALGAARQQGRSADRAL